MSWQLYLAISILFISCNALFHRSLMKDDRSHPQAQTLAFLGLGGIIALLCTLFLGKLQLAFPPVLWINFLLLALLETPAFLLNYRAYQLIGASEVVLFLVTGRLWTLVGALLFLRESITMLQIFGACIVLSGVIITRYEKRTFKFNRGIFFVLIAAFLFGMGDVDSFYILRSYDAINTLIYAEFLPVIALVLLQPTSLKKLSYYFRPNKALKVILLSLGDIIGTLALYFAYQAGGKASIIGPLSATRVLITVILAMLILHERKNIKNTLIGALITIVGVMLLL